MGEGGHLKPGDVRTLIRQNETDVPVVHFKIIRVAACRQFVFQHDEATNANKGQKVKTAPGVRQNLYK